MLKRSSSVIEDRKTFIYRLLESSIGLATIGFIIVFIITSYFFPIFISVFIIAYAMMWIFKILLNIIYTIQSFNTYKRYNSIDLDELFRDFSNKSRTIKKLRKLKEKFKGKINWQDKLDRDISLYQNIDGKFLNPYDINQCTIFSIYNEDYDVMVKSLRCVYKTKWPFEKLFVTITQEARAGKDVNDELIEKLSKDDWIHLINIDEILENNTNIEIKKDRLNVMFTRHPDGLVGEIKGKASNEDWACRRTFKLLKEKLNIDFDMTLATSLDADSHLNPYFFHHLAYRYILSENRYQSGYQPVHIYSNNFFQTGLFPRLVATQTTIYNLTNLSIADEAFFFAIYSVPARVLIDVDFWVRDIIAEDSLLFSKCLTHYDGNFKIHPHAGVFQGDAVEANDYLQEIINQYKQLQRWSWGGVEGFPYLFKRLWLTKESKNIPLLKKLKWTYLKFGNHFFWVTTPFVFSIGSLIPEFIHSRDFSSAPVAQNLSVMTQYFAWVSFIFIFVFAYLTIVLQAKSAKKGKRLTISDYASLILQFALSPTLFGFMAIPAIDAQLRGILGKYMGYWVTPKK